MSETKELQPLDAAIETSLNKIDEERLPEMISQRLELLEKTNNAYNTAKEKEKDANEKVQQALTKADLLITESKNVGQNKAKERKFLWVEYSKKSDEIEAIKKNLTEMIFHGENSAKAQKELVEVQSALANSQAALLEVQKTQMEYQEQIANITKFLYGLCAYNMGSVQSVLVNLEAVFSGASAEKLGEMAQQQLFLAMDQIKNQESLLKCIRENKEIIDSLDFELETQGSAIDNLQKQDEEQDDIIEDLQKQDEEQDILIEDLQKQDEEQDKLIAQNAERAEQHERLIQEAIEADEEQDKLIAQNAERAEEHERLIQEAIEADEEQDKLIAQNAEKVKENARLIQEALEADEEQDKLIELQREKDSEHDRCIKELQNEVMNLKDEIEQLQLVLADKGNKLQTHIITGVAAVATILAIIGLFL